MAGKSSLKLWVVQGDAGSAGPRPAPRADESVGLFLRLLRERNGLSLVEAAAEVRIREAYVTAIEDDRFDALPGRAYAIGFVRAYAEVLGADVEATARAASQEIGRLPEPKLRTRKPEAERDSRFAPVAAAAICVALAGYVYWYFENTRARFETAVESLARIDAPNFIETADNPTAGVVDPYRPFPDAKAPSRRPQEPTTVAAADPQPVVAPSVAPPIAPSAAPTIAAPPQAAAPEPDLTAAPPPSERVIALTAPATASLPPPQTLAADLPEPRLGAPASRARSIPSPGPAMASTPDLTRLSPGYAAAATAPTEPPPPPAPGQVTLFAAADTWIEIKAVNTGKVLFSRVLRQGETLPAPDRHGLVMTVGNAGGLEIRVDGEVAPSLGVQGQVVRDVSLVGASLLARAQ